MRDKEILQNIINKILLLVLKINKFVNNKAQPTPLFPELSQRRFKQACIPHGPNPPPQIIQMGHECTSANLAHQPAKINGLPRAILESYLWRVMETSAKSPPDDHIELLAAMTMMDKQRVSSYLQKRKYEITSASKHAPMHS